MTDENERPQWQATTKGPALLTGLILILGGTLLIKGRWKYSLPFGGMLLIIGFCAVVYSTTVHEWCSPVGRMRWSPEFGAGFRHGPNAWDCYHLVMGHKNR